MFRINPIQTTTNSNLQNLQKRNSLRRVLSSASNKSFRKSVNIKRSSRGSFIIRKKQKREIEQLTLGKVYMIVHLCAGEIIKRGLTEPNIFKPLPSEDEKDEVRHLITCLMKDNRIEFENELTSQKVNNIVVGIRMALRNCTFDIIPYDYYARFVRDEQECQYDPENGCFNQFLSYLSRQSQGILIELFDLFALTMENSHINRIHPTRILKSMSLHIFNESQTKSYENFLLAYQDWLRYSNALIHLFLAYIRERACTTELPEKLSLLLHDYVGCRKRCFMNSVVCENGKEVIFQEHTLPDITIPDLEKVINNEVVSVTTNKRIMSDLYPDSDDQKRFNFFFDGDQRTAEVEWDELQQNELNILSEEALNLLFAYDDQEIVLSSIDLERRKSISNEKKQRASQRKNDRWLNASNISTLHSKMELINDSLNDVDDGDVVSPDGQNNHSIALNDKEWDDFKKKGFRDSIESNSNLFSLTSTLGPTTSSDNGGNSTMNRLNSTSNKTRGPDDRQMSSLFCVNRRPYSVESKYSVRAKELVYEENLVQTTIDLSEGTNLMINYDWMGSNVGERLGEWICIETTRSGSGFTGENKKRFTLDLKKSINNTNKVKLLGRISIRLSKMGLTRSKSSKRDVRKSHVSIYSPPSFQLSKNDSIIERPNPSHEQTQDLFSLDDEQSISFQQREEKDPEPYQMQNYQEREEYQHQHPYYQYQDDIYIDESLGPQIQDQNFNPSYQERSTETQDHYYTSQYKEDVSQEHYYPESDRGKNSLYSSIARSSTLLSRGTSRNINSSASKSSQYSGVRGKDLPYPITPQRQNSLSSAKSPRIRNIPRQHSPIPERQVPTYSRYSQQYPTLHVPQSRSPQYSARQSSQRQRQQYQKYPEQPQQTYNDDSVKVAGRNPSIRRPTNQVEKIVQYEQPIQQYYEHDNIIESETIEGNDSVQSQQFQEYAYSQQFLSNNYI